MTPNKVIEIVDRVKPNTYTEEDKLRWINELDGMVKRLVFQWDEKYLKNLEGKYKNGEITKEAYEELINKTKPYEYPEDMDRELLIPAPYDEDLYTLYVQTKIDFYNREYTNYNNTATMFEIRYDEYKKDYIRNHRAKG